jgi:hypothetical protein
MQLRSMENSVTLLLSISFLDTAFIIMELNMMQKNKNIYNYSFIYRDISFWIIGFPYVGLVEKYRKIKDSQETLPSGIRLLMLYLHCRFQL